MKPVIFCIILLLFSGLGLAQDNKIVRKIKFTGNKHISNSQLTDETTIHSSSWITEKILRKEPVYYTPKLYYDDIRRLQIFYQKRGYLNVSFGTPTITVNNKNKVKITVPVVEGEPVRISDVSFTIDSVYSLDEVTRNREKKHILFKSETATTKTFRDQAIINDKELIAEIFYNKGFPYTKVKQQLNVDTITNTTNIHWTIDRGPLSYFGKTKVNGNSRVPAKSILRQLAYNEGDIWSKEKIDQSQKQIYNQGNYRVASVRTLIDTEIVDTLNMQIQINEAPRWTTRFGVGYGREDLFRAYVDQQYLGFITHTGRINFYAKHSGLEPYNFYLRFSQPSFLFPINTLSVYPYIQKQNEPGYKLDKIGYNISFLQNFSDELNTSVGFIYEDVDLDMKDPTETNTEDDIETVYKKSGIVIGGIYNNSKPILDPLNGFAVSLNTKTNDIFFSGEIPFYRILTEFKTYFGLKRGVILALKTKMGAINRTDNETFIPIEERFFAGGSHSVRGWARSELGPKDDTGKPIGGNSLFESSAEFRIDLIRNFKMILFADAGNVWVDSFTYEMNDLHYSAGAGLRIDTPIGPTGLDFARPVFDKENSWQIHFNIGYTF